MSPYESQARILAAKSPLSKEQFSSVFSRDVRELMHSRHKLPADTPDAVVSMRSSAPAC